MSGFFSSIFQAALAMEGILFAAFGFLFAAYCQYSSSQSRINHLRAPIANKLARACLFICWVITINALLAIYVLVRTILFTDIEGFLLGLVFTATIVAVAWISWWLALTM